MMRQRMINRGPMVTYLPVGLTPGICCNSPMQRKKMLAYRLNCSNKNFGMKVMGLYFPVEI